MARFHATAQGDVPFTAEEEAEWDAMEAAYAASADTRKATIVREERNTRLSATDWTQTLDAPQAVKDSYAPYRQALRDLPTQSGFPFDVQWPTKPE